MKVNVERVLYLVEELAKINSVPLDELELHYDNAPLEVNPEVVDDFKFLGLNNVHFITSGYFENKEPRSRPSKCSIGTIVDKSKATESIQKPLKSTPYYKKKCGCTGSCMCWTR